MLAVRTSAVAAGGAGEGASLPALAFDTPVLVVGAGPAGAVLALELARHGVPSMVVERSSAASVEPKMDCLSGRSMELLRRLGLAGALRAGGIGGERPIEVLWTAAFAEPPILRWRYPSVEEVRARYAGVNDGSAPEPYQRVPGPLLEELTRKALHDEPLVDLREGWICGDVRLEPDGVVATVADARTGLRHTVEARYLAACDGSDSAVRRCLGIALEPQGPATGYCTVYFRSRDPILRKDGPPFITVAAGGASLVSRDDGSLWSGTLQVATDEPLTDPVLLIQQRLGTAFAVDEVLGIVQRETTLAVATTYGKGSVYLVGDAAHPFHPVIDHGANTALGDAVDLGWKLAASVSGWGGPDLLASYEAERRPIALFDRERCAALVEVRRRFTRLYAAGMSREHLAGVLEQEMRQVDSLGVHFGHRYTNSPVVWREQAEPPSWDWHRIVPTTWPGGRAPAVRLADGGELFDRFDVGFTLVDLSGNGLGGPLVAEAARRGVPMTHLSLDDAAVRACWERDLVLVRPDEHVAWRGDLAPADWGAVLDRVTGQGTTRTRHVYAGLDGQTRA
jgi:2-polyprenyl-6-methoxyphenol hydroxylase-like FAD-dependent oxidoreductase